MLGLEFWLFVMFLSELHKLHKHASLQVCWKCGATKGTSDARFSYVNLSHDAPWRSVSNPIWDVRPSFADLVSWL